MKLLGYLINIGAVVILPQKIPVATICMTVLFLAFYILRVYFEMVNY